MLFSFVFKANKRIQEVQVQVVIGVGVGNDGGRFR